MAINVTVPIDCNYGLAWAYLEEVSSTEAGTSFDRANEP